VKILFIVKTIETESSDLKHHDDGSRLKQWRIEKGYQGSTTTAVNNQSQTSLLIELCIPFRSCSATFDHTILVILAAIVILMLCCHFLCYERRDNKNRGLPNGQLTKPQHYCYTNTSVHNNGFLV
jgi:hypothetical protein